MTTSATQGARTGIGADLRSRLGTGIGLLRAAADGVADLVFPPCCLACRAATAGAEALCPACWRVTRFIERPYCLRLGTPFAADLGAEGLLSPEAIAEPPVYGRARAVAQFEDGPARVLVHRLKYGDRGELARAMGAWMARAGDELTIEADVLVPVPLHRARLAARRYNQAALLAAVVSRRSGVPLGVDVLRRARATAPQVGLTRSQRALNVQGAFTLRDEARPLVEGRRVVLVDDVLTAGATVTAASRVLLRGGAAAVDVLVFARVVAGQG